MMTIPDNLKYTKTHEWARLDDDGLVTVGITHHAQDLLGDMVFVENPPERKKIRAGDECAVVESVKAAADVYAPVSGEVFAVNKDVEGAPEKINQDPYEAWLFKIKPDNAGDLADLLTPAQYQELAESDEH
jgi:glycine cleavage system H protein